MRSMARTPRRRSRASQTRSGTTTVPFLTAGMPALDIIDFTFGGEARPGAYWHTTEDTLDKVCPESLEAVGEPALRVLDPSG